MPEILRAEEMLNSFWSTVTRIEEAIQRDFLESGKDVYITRLPLPLVKCAAMHGPIDKHMLVVPGVVCTPVIQFCTTDQGMEALKEAQAGLLGELKAQEPKQIGNLHVACSVNPGHLCYEMVLAIPFSKEESKRE